MIRRILAIILVLLAMIVLIGVGGVLAYTPLGTRVISTFGPPTPTPKPILTVRGTPPMVNAKATYLLDADTGHVLVDVQGQQRLPMASTTKIMTALITIETADLNKVVTIKQDAIDEVRKNNGSSAQLVVGDQIRLKDLLYALLLPSGDDAAISVADAVSGSPANFVQLMNQYAQRLHLVQLTRIALNNPLFAQIIELQRYFLPATAQHHAYTWVTTDDLLSEYAGAIGVKTGFTVEAGYCLVFAATSAGHHLIGAVMNDSATDPNRRFVDAAKLLDWGFALPLLPPPAPTPQ